MSKLYISDMDKDFLQWLSDGVGNQKCVRFYNVFFDGNPSVATPQDENGDFFTLLQLLSQEDYDRFVHYLMCDARDDDDDDDYESPPDYDPVDSGEVIYIGDGMYMSSHSDAMSDDPWDLI